MKNTILLIVASLVLGCNKEAVEPELQDAAKNKVEATLTFTNGEVRKFTTEGPNVVLGCADRGSYLNAYRSPESIDIIYINRYKCVTRAGTYDFSLNYFQNLGSSLGPQYWFTSWTSKQGRFTYRHFDGKYAEGYFDAVCKTSFDPTDSIIVKGTFSGYLK